MELNARSLMASLSAQDVILASASGHAQIRSLGLQRSTASRRLCALVCCVSASAGVRSGLRKDTGMLLQERWRLRTRIVANKSQILCRRKRADGSELKKTRSPSTEAMKLQTESAMMEGGRCLRPGGLREALCSGLSVRRTGDMH